MQTSAKNLPLKKKQQVFEQFYFVLSDLKSPKRIHAFLHDFLSETEQIVFAKRLEILKQLDRGESYSEIKKGLNVSSATISSASNIKNKPGIKMGIEKIEKRAGRFKLSNVLKR